MDERKELIKRGEEKLTSAKNLLEDGRYADAISRAYYGMFYSARAILASRDIYPKTHKGVISEAWKNFGETGLMDKKLLGEMAASQAEREEADYGIYTTFTKEEAERIVENAQNFLEKCKQLLKK